jgi:hypothetical protein
MVATKGSFYLPTFTNAFGILWQLGNMGSKKILGYFWGYIFGFKMKNQVFNRFSGWLIQQGLG